MKQRDRILQEELGRLSAGGRALEIRLTGLFIRHAVRSNGKN